ncbi:MAG: adenylate/guanylate cyclase domain-containing protein [Acidimicrobiales bacterium]
MAEPPSGKITFLFTDIEGSTPLWRDRPEEMKEAVAEHDSVIREVLDTNDGYVFGVGGDGFFAAFSAPANALSAAITLQAGFAKSELINIRIGLHSGEASFRDSGFFGLEVNRTARITTCGHGGQIVVSGVTAALSGTEMLRLLGRYRLRGIDDATDIWQVGEHEFAPLRTDLQSSGNVTAERDRFVGRERELSELVTAIRGHPLTSIIGPGGVGKTRFARECAPLLQSDFPDGVWFASLASLTEPGLIASTVVAELGLPLSPETSDEDLLRRWLQTKQALLIIDNCEHLVDDAAAIIDRILDGTAPSKMLVTSQVTLGIRGETVFPLTPLAGTTRLDGSYALFVERALEVRPDLEFGAADEQAIEQICSRLDHLPLAIELAASRVRVMTPTEISQRLDERFRLLSSTDRTATNRHRTLEAALRWSHDLLGAPEQAVLRRLATFAGSFTIEQAQAISADDEVDSWQVLDSVMDLVERSLVQSTSGTQVTRYHLFESVKELGRVELVAHDELARCQERFVVEMHRMVLEIGVEFLGPDDHDALERSLKDWFNIQAALQLALRDDSSPRFEQMFAALYPLWNWHGHTTAGAQWANELLARGNIDAQERIAALSSAAMVVSSDTAAANEPFLAEAERVWREFDTDPPVVVFAIRALSVMLAGDNDLACTGAGEVLDLCRSIETFTAVRGHAVVMALSILSLAEDELTVFREAFEREQANADAKGSKWFLLGLQASASRVVDRLDIDDPVAFVETTAKQQFEAGYLHAVAHTYEALAMLLLQRGRFQEAAKAQIRAVEQSMSHGRGYMPTRFLHVVAVLLAGNPRDAARFLGHIRSLRDGASGASKLELAADVFFESILVESCGESFDDLVAEGRALDDGEAVSLAFASLQQVADSRPTVASAS